MGKASTASRQQAAKGKRLAVVGSGMGGLAAAIRLACMGAQVEVFEANSGTGGKLAEIRLGAYRFDAGPSLFTLPQQVDELFRLAGEEPQEHFRYQALDPITQYFWEDGARLQTHSDVERTAAAAEALVPGSAALVAKHLQRSARLYETLGPLFMERSLHRPSTWLNAQALKAYLKLPSLGLSRSMHQANVRHLQHPKLVQLFDRYATYNGSDPYQSPATMHIIPHLEFGMGAYFPQGGMVQIARSLTELARRLGVQFHLNSPVEQIMLAGGNVVGLEVAGEKLAFDAVVSNMDMNPTYRKLLPTEKAPEKLLRQEKSSSALIFYWGISGQFAELGVHNIFFSQDYQQEFRQLFQEKTLGTDPTVYVHVSSKVEPSDAPTGCENWFVMVNAPHLAGQDWPRLQAAAKEAILAKLSRMLGRDIAQLIEQEDVLDPGLIASRTSSHLGALYGNASNSRFAAFLRHPNWSPRLRGLYFCGGSVHPGGGIPLALLSGRLAAEAFERGLR